jgi:GNAT superfamily N-acetyltransferase
MKLIIKDMLTGLISAQNDEIILNGGLSSGNSPSNLTCRRYSIYDKEIWSNETQDNVKVGFVDLFVKDGEESSFGVAGLANIEVNQKYRKKGIARKVVDAILHTTGQSLEIFDIQKEYTSTWRKLGVQKFHDGLGVEIKVSKHMGTIFGTIPSIELSKTKEKYPNYTELGM